MSKCWTGAVIPARVMAWAVARAKEDGNVKDLMEEVQLRDDEPQKPEKRTGTDSNSQVVGFFINLRGQLFTRTCRSTAQLTGKTVIITGGNTGIGKETALDLAKRGAEVIIACRDTQKGLEAASDIRELSPSAKVIVKSLDLASFASVRSFVADVLKNVPRIHILINNAGLATVPKSKTEDGFEMQFGVNHLGHFLLTTLLLDRIKESAPARIVNVASSAHWLGKMDFTDINLDRSYNPFSAYGRSKLANILFTKELAKRLESTGVTTYCLHPGAVNTGLGRHLTASTNKFTGCCFNGFSRLFFLSPKKGAQTTIHCAVEESIAQDSGFYYCDCSRCPTSAKARDDVTAKKLWELSETLITTSQ